MEIALLENGWWEEDGRAGVVLHQRGEPPPLSLPDCARLLIVVNGGAARQVDYKVTINNPFQMRQGKLWVVFVLYVWVQFVPFAMICIRVVASAIRWLLAIIPVQPETGMSSIKRNRACCTCPAPSHVREYAVHIQPRMRKREHYTQPPLHVQLRVMKSAEHINLHNI